MNQIAFGFSSIGWHPICESCLSLLCSLWQNLLIVSNSKSWPLLRLFFLVIVNLEHWFLLFLFYFRVILEEPEIESWFLKKKYCKILDPPKWSSHHRACSWINPVQILYWFAFEMVNLYVWNQFEQSLVGVVLLFDHYKCCESIFLVTSAWDVDWWIPPSTREFRCLNNPADPSIPLCIPKELIFCNLTRALAKLSWQTNLISNSKQK